MMRLLIGLALLLWLLPDDGARQGRRGNAAYRAGRYAEAAESYRQGLLLTRNPVVRFGLQYNLGAALLRLDEAGAARAAFDAALHIAPDEAARARAAYNAGNAAFAEGNLQAALHYYRTALLADPNFEDARFNYEYVLRHLPPEDPPPSAASTKQNGPNGSDTQPASGQNPSDGDRRQDPGESPARQNAPDAPATNAYPETSASPARLSPQAAARLLDALQRQEQEALRRALRLPTRPPRTRKDW